VSARSRAARWGTPLPTVAPTLPSSPTPLPPTATRALEPTPTPAPPTATPTPLPPTPTVTPLPPAPTPTPAPAVERILFAPGATHAKVEGYLPAYGTQLYVMGVAAGQFIAVARLRWARWYPDLAPGRYEVYVYIPERYSTTAHARYWVSHRVGLTLRRVNQAANGGRWVSLGTYRFRGTRRDYVSLADVTFERYLSRLIAFDAAKWVPR
jgi:hypothetical protein